MRLENEPEPSRSHLAALPCPTYGTEPWVPAPPLAECRVAIVSTAGIQRRGDRPFAFGATDYRVIARDDDEELVMSHVSTNFDRTGFQQDVNVVFPLDRLQELAAEGVIASVARFHYAFMGATHPDDFEAQARDLAGMLKADAVDAALLVPV